MNGGSLSTWNEPDPGKKWGTTIAGSLALHALLFSFFFIFFPPSPAGRLPEPAYVVDLVSLGGGPAAGSSGAETPPPKALSPPLPPRSAPPPKAIPLPKTPPAAEKKMAPPAVEKKISPPAADSQVLDLALERMKKKKEQERSLERSFHRLENKVKNQEALEQALARLERKAGEGTGKGNEGPRGEGSVSSANPAGSPGAGLQFQMYHASLRARIKKNWVLPEGLLKKSDISADLILRIGRNGRIEAYQFERKSGVVAFDQEVVRTLQKSDPLPPLPEGYPRNSYEVVLTFHSRDLGGQ